MNYIRSFERGEKIALVCLLFYFLYRIKSHAMFSKAADIEIFLSFIAPVFLIAFVSAMAVNSEKQSRAYEKIRSGPHRVRFAPPRIVFPIVWSILYTLIAIAGYLVRKQPWVDGDVRHNAVYEEDVNLWPLITFWILQVFLAFYMISFFGGNTNEIAFGRRVLAAFIVFVDLALAVVVAILFQRLSVWAGVFMWLLIGWLLFAFILSIAIVRQGSMLAAEVFVKKLATNVEEGGHAKKHKQNAK